MDPGGLHSGWSDELQPILPMPLDHAARSSRPENSPRECNVLRQGSMDSCSAHAAENNGDGTTNGWQVEAMRCGNNVLACRRGAASAVGVISTMRLQMRADSSPSEKSGVGV
jgi:hypothetical protein